MPFLHASALWLIGFIAVFVFQLEVKAGGSALNTIVVINRASSNSCEVGNYYCESRSIPPQNVVHISWSGSNIHWTSNDFYTQLAAPLQSALADRSLTNQARFVVLSMDIPYKTTQGTTSNGTTSALFYGPRVEGQNKSSYYLSELPIELARPAGAPSYSLLASFLTADSVQEAKAIVDSGVAADGSYLSHSIVLAKTSDPLRNLRYTLFDNVIINGNLLGKPYIYRTNSDTPWVSEQLAGLCMGKDVFSVPPSSFLAGCVADNMTSFGGTIFEQKTQTTLLDLLKAGAAASYGTVTEPGADTTRFPNPMVYYYQGRGFSMAEAYYQSINSPFLGIIVGDPLSTPFGRHVSGAWTTTNLVISGRHTCEVHFTGGNIDQVDLFINKTQAGTVTNVPPSAGNTLEVSVNGYPFSLLVTNGATIRSLAADMVRQINSASSIVRIYATNYGDRIELRSTATNQTSRSWFYAAPTNNGQTFYYRANYLPDPITPLLGMKPPGPGTRPGVQVRSPGKLPYLIQATTNFFSWESVYTNAQGTDFVFYDPAATVLPKRFYRVLGIYIPPKPPELSLVGYGPAGSEIFVSASNSVGWVLQGSTNLFSWLPLITNGGGANLSLLDSSATNVPYKFYRTAPIELPEPIVSHLDLGNGNNVIKVDNAVKPFSVESSTNLTNWVPFTTNLLISDITLECGSSKGTGAVLTTFASAARSAFLTPQVYGARQFTLLGSPVAGSYVTLQYTKTNGASGAISVTNSSGGQMLQLVQALALAVQTDSKLAGPDGLVITDAFTNAGAAYLNIQARSQGREAAFIRVRLVASSGLNPVPGVAQPLDSNVADLQPRNHILISSGLPHVDAAFPLETATLPNGHHELEAVAYEGSHVRSQTRVSHNVIVTNTPLWASFEMVGTSTNVSVGSAAEFLVNANTNTVSKIELFSTGGLVGQILGNPSGGFTVYGTNLGVGLHPFYSTVQTTNGWKFRSEVRYVRFTN